MAGLRLSEAFKYLEIMVAPSCVIKTKHTIVNTDLYHEDWDA